jgi:1-pyrroline-5-carboxylate dehydrogenase
VDPGALSGSKPGKAYNCVDGEWVRASENRTVPDPLNGEPFISYPNISTSEAQPFIDSLRRVPKTGLHNPLKNPERYLLYGAISARMAEEMRKPEVADFFARLVQRVAPKHYAQAMAEVTVTRLFLENFSGDQVRFMARSFGVSGDHAGQTSQGYRWPFGPVGIITPFNFPLEIPALQLMGALYMGNKPLLHVDRRVSIVAEHFVRLLQHCGMPETDVDFVHGDGKVVGHVLKTAPVRSTLFTGSQAIAEHLVVDLKGKVFLEDAGFDWKVLGPDVSNEAYVAWQCDQDAYACSGQKCSATSLLFMHANWVQAGLEKRLAERAGRRKLEDLSIGPVLSWTTERMLKHVDALLKIPGARLAWGGKPLEGHSIPEVYGAIQPTAVFVPLDQILASDANWELVNTELFGPFQVLTEYNDETLPAVLGALERMSQHLTAAVVSNDRLFQQKVLANTVNGTSYTGIRGRTTGAPQNHWFGPSGDPRGAGIGTPEAIRLVWSAHREIVTDEGPVPTDESLLVTT